MKKVLIALDYDPSAEKVAETGYAFAKAMSAEVTLLHVMADTMYYVPLEYSPIMGFAGITETGMIEPADMDELKNGARKFLEASKLHLGDTNIKTLISEGNFADAIINAANAESADLIVVGSHSRSALEKMLTGSVTEKLLHDATIPLMIVPTKKK